MISRSILHLVVILFSKFLCLLGTKPINFLTQSRIEGEESQILVVDLQADQILRAESGSLFFMEDDIEMKTSTGGSLKTGFKRLVTGNKFFVTDFVYKGYKKGQVALTPDYPCKIIKLSFDDFTDGFICQQDAFLAGSHTIDINPEFTKSFGVGLFGGKGFILQKLTGTGDAFIKASGVLKKKSLSKGQTLRVSPGCLVAFSTSITYDICRADSFINAFFGEGIFLATLHGPGTVYLQSFPYDRMVNRIKDAMSNDCESLIKDNVKKAVEDKSY